MPAGDAAGAKGLHVYTGNENANELHIRDNERGDEIAAVIDDVAGKAAASHTHTSADITDKGFGAGKVPVYTAGGRIISNSPSADNELATKVYVDSAAGAADGPSSAAYSRNAVGSGLFTVWMNSALQFMRNTSSRRYKKNIRDWRPGNFMGIRTVIFDRRGKDGEVDEVGFIAEEMHEAVPEAVVYFGGKIDGIQDRAILAATVSHLQELTRRVVALEQKDGA